MASSDEEDFIPNTPPDLVELAKEAKLSMLPKKSRERFEQVYNLYTKWKTEKKVTTTTENVILAYYEEFKQKYKPSTAWSHFSILRMMIQNKEDIDVTKISSLYTLLKNNANGFQAKKAKVFTGENLKTFIENAPDAIYLASKVVVIFGVCGCCRGDELIKIELKHITEEGNILIVDIAETKTSQPRQFSINKQLTEVVNKYRNLRPKNTNTTRFFLNYQKQKCTKQPVDKNKIAAVPKEVATWLKLEDPDLYTGHALRRTSATLLSNAGGTMTDLKHLGGWQSDRVAHGYVENSLLNKAKISKLVTESFCPEISEPIQIEKRKILSQEFIIEDSVQNKLSPIVKKMKISNTEEFITTNSRSPKKVIYINNSSVNITF